MGRSPPARVKAVSQRGLVAEAHRSALWQHVADHHDGQKGDGVKFKENFSMKVTGRNYNTSARRLIAEGIRIERQIQMRDGACSVREGERRPDLVLNSRREWYQPRLIRVKATNRFS